MPQVAFANVTEHGPALPSRPSMRPIRPALSGIMVFQF